jgi:hypothetical protein
MRYGRDRQACYKEEGRCRESYRQNPVMMALGLSSPARITPFLGNLEDMTRTGQKTRNPKPEPGIPEAEPEILETRILFENFG